MSRSFLLAIFARKILLELVTNGKEVMSSKAPVESSDAPGLTTRRAVIDTIEALRAQIESLVVQESPDGSIVRDPAAVRRILKARQRRSEYFGADLFGEPAWDIILELFAAELEDRRISVTSLCIASGVAPTTALRWIQKLEQEGFVFRESDKYDGRRHWMKLTSEGGQLIRRYFRDIQIGSPLVL